jgi:hypothetical protein
MDTARRRGRSARATRLTERDRIMLAFAAEHRFVVAAQLAALLDVSRSAADARLRALGAFGCVRREHTFHRRPPSDQITRQGLKAVGSDLPTPRKLDLATYRHDLGLGWLMLAARRERFGPVRDMVSERRMRSEDGRAAAGSVPHGVRLGGTGPGGRDRLHYPDMVVGTGTGHRVAFELELTSKSPDRRERILAGYAADRRIDAVVYLVEHPAAGRAIERSATRVGIAHMVHVQRVDLGDSGRRPEGGRAAERTHARAEHASRAQAVR